MAAAAATGSAALGTTTCSMGPGMEAAHIGRWCLVAPRPSNSYTNSSPGSPVQVDVIIHPKELNHRDWFPQVVASAAPGCLCYHHD